MSDASLQITVGADVQQAVNNLQSFESELKSAQRELGFLGRAIDIAISKGQDISALEDSFQKVNNRIKELQTSAQGLNSGSIGNVKSTLDELSPAAKGAAAGMDGTILKTTQARIAFIDFGRVVTGQGFSLRALASNFSLLGPGITIAAAAIYGLIELLSKQTAEEKKAAEQAKQLQQTLLNLKSAAEVSADATGSEQGNIARVQALAAAITDTNKSYSERKNALEELRETNKAYFGDLTLETATTQNLSQKVRDYSQALITEAIVKGQVDTIAKLSAEYQKQIEVLNKLRDARDSAQYAYDKQIEKSKNLPADQRDRLLRPLDPSKEEAAYRAQIDVVDKLSVSLAAYRGELDKAIQLQIQQKPLKTLANPDDLKSIIPILEQIQRIYQEMSKPSKEPLFKQNELAQQLGNPNSNAYQLFQAKIKEAFANGVEKGANDPKIKAAYDALAHALQAQLSFQKNPDLHAHFAYQLADIDDKDVKKFRDDAGKQLTDYMTKLPPLKSDVKVELSFTVFQTLQQSFKKDLDKLQAELVKNVDSFSVAIGNAFLEDVGKAIGDAFSGKGIQAAFDSFMEFLGDSIIKIGEQLVVAAGVFSLIDVALGSLFDNPALAAAAGIGAIAVGEVIKNSFKAKPFAVGGIVTGPTLGLIGEAGPEVVFPLNRLNRFLKESGGGQKEVKVTGIIRGRDLALVQARDSKLQGMTS